MEILNAATSITSQLLEGTSSTARVQQMVQRSLTPVFLLAAIGAFLNVINQRLTWIVDRVHALETESDAPLQTVCSQALPRLRQRRKFAHMAINLSTGAGLFICMVVGLTFVSAFALCWIAAMLAVFGALVSFLMETQLAMRSSSPVRIVPKARARERERERHSAGLGNGC
jgi:hypothetical protein